ncbi:MAG: hypothetical protein QMD95_02405 [Candidatus Hodarchaeaceae archaeon]|nr:hypothetical protein [Candidatus Hodarchaeaceae archaeon]
MSRGCEDWKGEMPPGSASRTAASIVVGIGWLIFLVLFLWFYAEGLGIYKSLAIFVLSILVVGVILALMWVSWGIKTARVWKKKVRRKRKK